MHDTDPYEEARHFHRWFAGEAETPPDVARNYAEACRALGIGPGRLTGRLCAAGADLVCAEFALRRRKGPANELTQRALVLLALLEARPGQSRLFLLSEPSVTGAWLELVSAPFCTFWQAVKGSVLLWWHER